MTPAITETAFRDYIAAFNRDDFDAFTRFYSDDIVLVLGGKRELRGRQAIIDFYKTVKALTHRQIVVNRLIIGSDGLAAELESTFTALEDLPEGMLQRPLKRGETYHHVTFALYDIKDGRYTRIRSARYQST